MLLMAVRYRLRELLRIPRRCMSAPAMHSIAVIALIIIAPMAYGIKPINNGQREMTQQSSVERLRQHVETLAGQIGERNVFRPQALREAADYIEKVWKDQGYDVMRHEYDVKGERVTNLEVTRAGYAKTEEIVLVGAHYDSILGSPGANDNGSGVAAMLELSRYFATRQTERTLRFVAFVNEEPPFFKTNSMGSRVYAKMVRARGDNIRAMLCLETIGFYSDAPESQHYPPLFNLFYPDTGNFIGFVSNFRSRPLLRKAVAAFRAASDFPIEHVATFGFVPGVDWSDHWSFWREGVPAIMITDTALYRYPYYHSLQDTPDKVNYKRLARVTEGFSAVVDALVNSG